MPNKRTCSTEVVLKLVGDYFPSPLSAACLDVLWPQIHGLRRFLDLISLVLDARSVFTAYVVFSACTVLLPLSFLLCLSSNLLMERISA